MLSKTGNLLLDGQRTERLTFRKILADDYQYWLPFFQDPKTSEHWMSLKESPTVACEKWYQKQFHRYENRLGGMNVLHNEVGQFIGHCGLLVQTVDDVEELEIGYSLLRPFWNNGYATEAAIKCRDYAFENQLSDSLISIISITNAASEKVALKNEMSYRGRTLYQDNHVNIFEINRNQWMRLNKFTKPSTF